jgi:hypothetical protein
MERITIAVYKGFSLIDELYPDDDGFNKHTWLVETSPNKFTEVPDTGSYTELEIAVDKFYQWVDSTLLAQENI